RPRRDPAGADGAASQLARGTLGGSAVRSSDRARRVSRCCATVRGPNHRGARSRSRRARARSEEHTSELQSRFDLVCRLLLEKKNKTITELLMKARKTWRRTPILLTHIVISISFSITTQSLTFSALFSTRTST